MSGRDPDDEGLVVRGGPGSVTLGDGPEAVARSFDSFRERENEREITRIRRERDAEWCNALLVAFDGDTDTLAKVLVEFNTLRRD